MSNQPAINSLLQQYIPALSSYNELFSHDNHIRSDWQNFFASLHELGPAGIAKP